MAKGGQVQIAPGVIMPLMGFGTFKITEPDKIYKCLDCALNTGYRLIDTAHFYQNEAFIGTALKDLLPKHNLKREDIFLTTKVVPPKPLDEVRPGVLGSLDRLQTIYLDLVLIHSPMAGAYGPGANRQNPENRRWRKETWTELEKLVSDGYIRAIGVSNYEPNHLQEMSTYASIPAAVNQTEFHPHFTRSAVRAECAKTGIHFQAFTSLGRNNPDLMSESLLCEIAQKHSATVPQVLLAWAMKQGVSVLPKSENPDRIEANFAAIYLDLSGQEIAAICALNKDRPYSLCRPWEIV